MSDADSSNVPAALPSILNVPIINNYRLTSVKFSSVGDVIWINEIGQAGYVTTNGKILLAKRDDEKLEITFFEMINKNKFVYVLNDDPKTVFYHVHAANLKYYADTQEPIIGLRYHGNRLAIIQLEYILIFKCNNNDDPDDIMEQKLVYNTSPNPRALFDIKNDIFVYPQVNKEQSLLVTYAIDNVAKELLLPKHKEIDCVAFNEDASLLAISQHNSPEVHIISLIYPKRIFKLLIGPETIYSDMYNINFSPDSTHIYCSTENGLVSIFKIEISESIMDDINFTAREVTPFFTCTFDSSPCICRYVADNSIQIVHLSQEAYAVTFSDETNIITVFMFSILDFYRENLLLEQHGAHWVLLP